MDPEGRRPAELRHAPVATAVAFGDLGDGGVHRREDSRIGIVDAEPQDTTDSIGQPATHLSDEHEARLLRSDSALVEVLTAFALEGHRTPAVGDLVDTSPGVVRHRELGAFVVVAHPFADVSEAHLAVGDDVERHGLFGSITHDVLLVLVHALIEGAEEAPYTGFASTQTAEVIGVVSLLEVEVLILTLEPSVLTSYVDYVLLVHAVLLVTEGDLVDTCLIGVSCDSVIGDADSYPRSALLLGALADKLHDPDFVLVSDGEGLTRAVVAVVADEVGHDADRFAS